MTLEQNKIFILNNLDKFVIDGTRGDFVNLEKDFKDNDYVIWKDSVKDYEEVKEKVIQEIVKDKSRWSSAFNMEVVEAITEAILLEKENWVIIYDNELTRGKEPKFYKYLPTGEEVSARFDGARYGSGFSWFLSGELGCREGKWKDYDDKKHGMIKFFWNRRKLKRVNVANPNSQQSEKSQSEEEEQFLKELEIWETEKGHNDNKEEIENLKKGQATEDTEQYSKEAQKRVEEKLKENQVKEGELNEENQQEWQKLKKGEITDPTQLVAVETKIKENIYQKEAEKKITYLTTQIQQVLKSPSSSQIISLKERLSEFISSGNIYYSNHKEKAKSLLSRLENYSTLNNNQNNYLPEPPNFSWKIVIPFLLVGLLIILVVLIKERSKKLKL